MSLPERWIAFRNRLLADPRFQAWAISSPLTRFIARRRARATFDLCAGFVYTQVLLACLRLGLLAALRERPLGVADAAREVGLPEDSAARLLAAAAAVDVTQPLPDGRFALGATGATLLGNPAVLAMIEHNELLYADLADPVALLRGANPGRLRAFWAYSRNPSPDGVDAAQAARWSRLMSASQPLVTRSILDAYDLRRHRRLLDVGGGDGTFAAAAGHRAPALELRVYDLPPVAALAQARFEREGLASRAQAIPGDFHAGALPVGADVISFVRVLHDHDDEAVTGLLRAAYAALPPGGVLLIAEPMAGLAEAPRMGDAYFGLYLLAMGQGRPRSTETYRRMTAAAGFGRFRTHPTAVPMQCQLVTAVRT